MLAEAQRAGVRVIFLSDHFRPPRDFMDSGGWRPTACCSSPAPRCVALVHPMASVFSRMEAPVPEFLSAVTAGDGLAFLSHIEERPDHPFDSLTGLEIYNRHYDAKRDYRGLLTLAPA